MVPTRFVDRISQTVSAGRVPYTHRLESGNIPFRNMQNIFTGLENAFAGPGWPWKPHKSKDHIFLHRNYVQNFFSTPIFYFFSKLEKKSTKNFEKKIFSKNLPKEKVGKKSKTLKENPKSLIFFLVIDIFPDFFLFFFLKFPIYLKNFMIFGFFKNI